MIFFRNKNKKQPKSFLNQGILKLAAVIFILYVVVMDYQQRGPAPVTNTTNGTAATPTTEEEKHPMPGAEAVVEDMQREEVAKPEIAVDPKLEIETLIDGHEESPQAGYGDTVIVKYTGMLEDQSIFEDTREVPATFVLGDGSVIPGLEQGIAGMKEGEVRQVIVPPELGYNPPFSNPKVTAESRIGFIVKLIDVQEGNGTAVQRLPFTALEMVVGTGDAVKEGDAVATRYAIYNAHGMQLARGEANFILGESKAPQDYAAGIAGMKKGGKRMMILPPSVLRDLETDLPNYELMHIEVELVETGDAARMPQATKVEEAPAEPAPDPATEATPN